MCPLDEAHLLAEVASSVFGLSLGPGRFRWLAAALKTVLVREAGEIEAVDRLAAALGRTLDHLGDRRIHPGDGILSDFLVTAGQVLSQTLSVLRDLDVPEGSKAKRLRVLRAADNLAADVSAAADPPDGHVAWVDDGEGVNLRMAPIDVGPLLDEHLFRVRPAVLTSATLSVGGRVEPTAWSLGLRDVGDRVVRHPPQSPAAVPVHAIAVQLDQRRRRGPQLPARNQIEDRPLGVALARDSLDARAHDVSIGMSRASGQGAAARADRVEAKPPRPSP